jgi:hypothetical protein
MNPEWRLPRAAGYETNTLYPNTQGTLGAIRIFFNGIVHAGGKLATKAGLRRTAEQCVLAPYNHSVPFYLTRP